jgi:hypothetical protein
MGYLVQGGAPPDASVSTDKVVDDAITLAKMAGGTDGNLISYDTNGDVAAVATGDSGQVLTSNGAGAAPTFQAAAGGGAWTLLATTNASNVASIAFTELDSSAYDTYMVVIENVTPAGFEVFLTMRTSTDGGSTYDNSGYRWNCQENHDGASSYNSGSTSDSEFQLHGTTEAGDAAEETFSSTIIISRPQDTTNTTFIANSVWLDKNGVCYAGRAGGVRVSAADVDAIQFLWTSGNFTTTGSLKLLGLTNAV